jgi:hypothetical protein
MNLFFRSDTDKKPIFKERPPRSQVEPKLTLTKRITGTWGVDVRFFDHYPKDFGTNTH